MSSFAKMLPETEIVDLEGGGAVDNQITEDLPDDDALFAPYTYSRSLAKPTLSKSAKGFTPFPSSIDQSVLDEITKTFKPRDSDIWIVSYPKSGTTWGAEILSQVITGESNSAPLGGGIALGLTSEEHVLWLEALCGKGVAEEVIASINAMPSDKPRLFKSHAPLEFIKLWTTSKSKVVYLARNPKDVCVSMWHHSRSKKTFNYEGPFNHFLNQIFLPGRAESGSWWSHVGTYFATENWQAVVENDDDDDPAPRLFCLWYEQMLRAPAEGVQGIAEFVGKSVSMVKAEEIVQACSFSSMKKSEISMGVQGCSIQQDGGGEGDVNNFASSQIRKGGAGNWKDYFTVRQNERFDKIHQRQLDCGNTAGLGHNLMIDFGDEVKGADSQMNRMIELLEGDRGVGGDGEGGCVIN
ncbi:hypothetical protein TrLO_g6894 [Triparma laevis f. longispina]|uniref:Sulfotransferase domain-containing protein n=1 Tax=Triparma laevis f. longispina TaxID=1714387 RepID=A0A9W7C3S9_9STRA|nr:hypothetical protein TrLO_g6894 [Triparma laevis f. longispina]